MAATTHCDFLVTVGYVASPQGLVAYYHRVQPERPVLLPTTAATYSQVAPRVNCPWLLLAGQSDPVTPLADSQVVAQAARSRQRREVLPVPGNHQESMMAFSDEGLDNASVQTMSRFLAGEQRAR